MGGKWFWDAPVSGGDAAKSTAFKPGKGAALLPLRRETAYLRSRFGHRPRIPAATAAALSDAGTVLNAGCCAARVGLPPGSD
jgi:hypothetical protein